MINQFTLLILTLIVGVIAYKVTPLIDQWFNKLENDTHNETAKRAERYVQQAADVVLKTLGSLDSDAAEGQVEEKFSNILEQKGLSKWFTEDQITAMVDAVLKK
jgi:hypothetical protein